MTIFFMFLTFQKIRHRTLKIKQELANTKVRFFLDFRALSIVFLYLCQLLIILV